MKPVMVFRLLLLSAALAVMSCAQNGHLPREDGGSRAGLHGHVWPHIPFLVDNHERS